MKWLHLCGNDLKASVYLITLAHELWAHLRTTHAGASLLDSGRTCQFQCHTFCTYVMVMNEMIYTLPSASQGIQQTDGRAAKNPPNRSLIFYCHKSTSFLQLTNHRHKKKKKVVRKNLDH